MNEEVKISINGLEVITRQGKTILEASLENGIYIPNLCYNQDLKPVGVCRLCLVDVGGRLITSCTTPVTPGMQIKTDTKEIENMRRVIVELLLINHDAECLQCARNTQCELQKVINYVGIDKERIKRLVKPIRKLPIEDSNPFFAIDHNKCIQCGICIRTCDELQGLNILDFAHRGFDMMVSTFNEKPLVETNCKSCAECAIRCPAGAMPLKTFQRPAREVKTTCTYCGCGCGLYLGICGNRIVSTRGDRDNPSNRGSLCVKGRFGFEFVNSPKRLTKPLIKRNGEFVEASWDEVVDLITKQFQKYKGDQFAMLSSAKATNEDNYVIQKFTRVVMETNDIDHCARLCHAPTVAGLKQTFGSGAMTNSIQEFSESKCIFAVGTNTTDAHPIIALPMKKAVRNGAKLIVANPRRIDLCKHAHIFLQHNPGTDVALLMGIAKVIIDENLHDKEFIAERCENFVDFKESLTSFNLDSVEQITGVPRDKIIEAARIYAQQKPGAILYAMGITQHTHGTDNVIATSNLALLTGNLGKIGSGVNPLRGQNNVQGACDMGALPNVYPGYQAVNDGEAKAKFESAWNATLSDQPGLTHLEIFDAILEGKIKVLYTAGENPILSGANSNHAREAIGKLEFFVTQDIFLTETAELADVVLPAATFAEKDGTFTNTERRVQRIRKAIEPIGESKADWQIVCEIAKHLGAEGFDFTSAQQIMEEIASLTPSYGGIFYSRLENESLQWPCPNKDHPGTPILHVDKFATSSGKGKFIPLTYKPSAELPNDEYPLILTTDRSIFHYHTATMTRKVAGLNELRKHEVVRINPKDAADLKVEEGEMVKIISRRGEITAPIKITDASSPGVIAMTFHFAETPTNVLTNSAFDPIAKIPETKVCAVRIEKL
jgi:formate dehydrogenase alpha subunit